MYTKDYVCKECGNPFSINNDPSTQMTVSTSHMDMEMFYGDDEETRGLVLHHVNNHECCMRMYSKEDIKAGGWGQLCMFKDCDSYDMERDFNIGFSDPDLFEKIHGFEPKLRVIKIDPKVFHKTSKEADISQLGDAEKILTEVLQKGLSDEKIRTELHEMEDSFPDNIYEKEDSLWELVECVSEFGDQMEVNQYFTMKELWTKAVEYMLDKEKDFYKITLAFDQYSYSVRLVNGEDKFFVDIYHPTFGLHMTKFSAKVEDNELKGVAILCEELFFRGGNGNVVMAKAKAMMLCGELIRMLVDIIKHKKGS